MQHSESLKELAKALSKAQAEFTVAVKDSTNPHYRSKYADFTSVKEASQPALNANGLSVIQTPSGGPDNPALTTMLLHTSGEWIKDTYSLPVVKKDPQAFGSGITYARRYAWAAILGLATEEDDDGNKASEPSKTVAPKVEILGGRELEQYHAEEKAASDGAKIETNIWATLIKKMVDDKEVTRADITGLNMGRVADHQALSNWTVLKEMHARLLDIRDAKLGVTA